MSLRRFRFKEGRIPEVATASQIIYEWSYGAEALFSAFNNSSLFTDRAAAAKWLGIPIEALSE
jgi:hypothetical protein